MKKLRKAIIFIILVIALIFVTNQYVYAERKSEDVNDFIEKIEKAIPENEYFNLYTLNTDFSNKLLDNNFPDCFYENLIMIIPDVKSFTMKNNTFFIKTKDSATREKFINSFIKGGKKYIKEISNEIHNKFNIDVEDYYIKQFINRKKFKISY